MIENEQFDTIYEIERIKYGDYNIIFNRENIPNGVSFIENI